MTRQLIARVVLGVFISVALFGLTALLAHSDHHVNCPLQGAVTVLCDSTAVEHIGIWQGMFVAIFPLLVLALGVSLCSRYGDGSLSAQRVRLRRTHILQPRPTVMQELYSAGILNRKEPYAFCV